MAQSRRMSFIEAVVNTASGLALGYAMNLTLLPFFFGYMVSSSQAISMTLMFAAMGMARSYIVRRIFNNWREQ